MIQGGEDIKTYQDLLSIGQDEKARMDFILAAINEYKSSRLYKTAIDAEAYYDGENPTINRYEKILYDMQGKAHVDMWTANHKIASSFFKFVVRQENGYLLGNGVTFSDDRTKGKLGTQDKPLDKQVFKAGKFSIIHGVSYGFWNYDHIDVFTATEYFPLYDENDGASKAGIRFWKIDDTKPLLATLYELDGYTEYIKRRGEDMEVLFPKRGYIIRTIGSAVNRARGDAIYEFENYAGFPIVPLKYDDKMRSEICGKRNAIDALDIAVSGMVNNVSEGNLIYWALVNCDYMDDLDDAQFIAQLQRTHVAHMDGSDGASATPHSIEAPFHGTQTTIEMLTDQLHANFMTMNPQNLSAGSMTATQIDTAYFNLDLKVDDYEQQVTAFINGIEQLAGIDDQPTYTRNKIKNTQEAIQTLLLLAPYVDDEYIVRKGLAELGDIDLVDDILKRKDSESLARFSAVATRTVETVDDELDVD